MKYLHIIPDSVFAFDFIKRVNRIYIGEEHYFIVHQCNGRKYPYNNVVVCDKVSMMLFCKVIIFIINSKKTILHSLFIDKKMFIAFAFLSVFLRKKFAWYIWSADLYRSYNDAHAKNGVDVKTRLKEVCRKIIIRNLDTIIVCARKDYRQAVIWYKTRARMVLAEYSFNLSESEYLSNKTHESNQVVMVGHSASDYGKHHEMLEFLSKFSNDNFNLISPLSYPKNESYVNSVISYGKKLFGDKFCAVTEWLSGEEYSRLLRNVDIVLIGGEVQMAVANIVMLLHMGKKVYLSEKNGAYEEFLRKGVKCFSIESVENEEDFFRLLSDAERKKNHDIIEKMCSDVSFKEKWDKVFH